MIKFRGWVVDVHNKYPQKIASVIPVLNEKIGLGCDYKTFDYLGYQEVNGKNHAVLAQQTVLNGADVNNAVVLIFNEKPNSMDVACADIRSIVQGGGPLGGAKVEISDTIPADAMDAFNIAYDGWVGSKITPFAFLGTQVTKGTNYIFAAKMRRVIPNAKDYLAVVVVNGIEHSFKFYPMLDFGFKDNPEDIKELGYAFTW